MEINRSWAMPNKHTFDIKPINKLIHKYLRPHDEQLSIDPFANKNKLAHITNDIDPFYDTDFNLDATKFLQNFSDDSVDFVLYDPPYSPRQVSEVYKSLDLTVNMQTTQSSYWGDQKKEIARILKQGNYCITFGWNSGGVGKTHGFEIVEILLVAHGGWHNDTICTVERKIIQTQNSLF